ncbi:MAG: DUF937 domain-containing protein [Dehalococcoidia bacterium]|nr:DUF937 domain-containing protein [Dehalococcoidia bacterium]MCA9824338.1 DUF937 domain-containing protein [Dehalococcoidia bacterium]MCA9844002.1 DUF937 domain-containing protein [Dehalococcoidia bacterium]
MSLVESILSANDGRAVAQIAKQVGIPESVAKKGIEALAPSLQRGLQRNTKKRGGAEGLLDALKSGSHARYVDDPATLEKEDSIADGNKILGHIFGNKDVSRNVAGEASGRSGIDSALLKKMLPMLGAVAMGAMAKNASGGSSGGSPLDALGGLLGGSGGGEDSSLDSILDLGKKFF